MLNELLKNLELIDSKILLSDLRGPMRFCKGANDILTISSAIPLSNRVNVYKVRFGIFTGLAMVLKELYDSGRIPKVPYAEIQYNDLSSLWTYFRSLKSITLEDEMYTSSKDSKIKLALIYSRELLNALEEYETGTYSYDVDNHFEIEVIMDKDLEQA